jgi:tRNA(Ile)-lysidine synthase
LRTVAGLAAQALTAAGVPAPGDGVAVAVSGGADSLTALHALRTLAPSRGFRLAVVTVDHGLRPESSGEAELVTGYAAQLGLPVRLVRADPEILAAHRPDGPEAAARAARYDALFAAADELGCQWVATGHTQDDQAETLLLALLRGSGPDGLAGMAVVSGRVLRPLLGVTRAQTEACCAAIGAEPVHDPSNTDERLLRNAVRRRVLPLLEQLRPGASATLARAAALARDDRAWQEDAAAAALAELRAPGGDVSVPAAAPGGDVSVPAAALAGLGTGFGRRVVRAAAVAAGQAVPTAAATDAVLTLAGHPGPPVRWPGGRVERQGDHLCWPVIRSASGA